MERTVQDLMRELMKQLMNINGEKKEAINEHSWREKCSERKMFGSHGFQQKTQSFVAQTGEICGILFHKISTVFLCAAKVEIKFVIFITFSAFS